MGILISWGVMDIKEIDISDIDWIFRNGYYVITNLPLKSLKTLLSYIESDRLEGDAITKYSLIVALAYDYLLKDDKQGFIDRCNRFNY
jgi:hypothetical protein